MIFLANENFPYPSIKILRDKGFEVISIGETLGGAKDTIVLEKAVKENLIILTFDRDYGELLFKYALEAPPVVVYFRLKDDLPEDAAKILIDRIENEALELTSYFTVIENKGTRQRKLL
ncbi:MAG: DUF5615 family PIN-like protein [Bacteroidetes bacterium]|nr:DUF5615 family PIN-like protein [Bacteroidota bacterium]